MRDVYIIGVGMTPFGKYLERSLKSLSEEAIVNAIKDSGISKEEVRRGFPLGHPDQRFQFLLVQLPSFR